uniref:Lipocalin n=1 Tax=Rhipicephalus appendiculatus TaxID=34631 RepID=A0A131YR39_RHIAP
MNYWVLTFLLGTYGVTCVENLSDPTLQDLRAFLNTEGNIYLYSSSHRNIFWDHPGLDEECTQYRPIEYDDDDYFFNTSYMLNCTWTSRPLNAWLKEDKHSKRPYLSQAIEHGAPSTKLYLYAYNAEAGCAFFLYTFGQQSNNLYCETQVRSEKVEAYTAIKGDICRNYTSSFCKENFTTIYKEYCRNYF